MQSMPADRRPDASLALLADPYRFIGDQCRRFGSDVFEARILLERSICMSGAAAAEVFYDATRFTRIGAAPEPLRKTLFGNGGVQTLDGMAHRHRKTMFMGLMTSESIAHLTALMLKEWVGAASSWAGKEVVLYDALHEPMMRAASRWAGVDVPEAHLAGRAHDLVELFDAAGTLGLGHFRARLARSRAEKWMSALIEDIRAGRVGVPPGSAAERIALHRELDGRLLPGEVAAVELINVLRPTLAVSVYIVHAAHALHRNPHCRERLRSGEKGYVEAFTQEVRRYYPFFPAVVARVRDDFQWSGFRFPRGTQTILDLYGTCHDARAWHDPDRFVPERFLERRPTAYDSIPQGGGEHYTNHRCPGEWITESLIHAATMFLVSQLRYEVPEQDLELDFARLPALPKSRFVMRDVAFA